MRQFAVLLAAGLVVAACSRHAHPPAVSEAAPASVAAPAAAVAATPSAQEEPDEATLQKIEFERYARIEAAGGLKLQVSQTGQGLTLHPKLYAVRKESCKPEPHNPGGYECSLMIKLSLDGGDPGEQGERLSVRRDAAGRWIEE